MAEEKPAAAVASPSSRMHGDTPAERVPAPPANETGPSPALPGTRLVGNVSQPILRGLDTSEAKHAFPLLANKSPIDNLYDYVECNAKSIGKGGGHGGDKMMVVESSSSSSPSSSSKPQRVSLLELLSYSSKLEKWLMALGLVMAALSGLCLPAWIVLLANSLDKFSSLAKLVDTVGGEGALDVVQDELDKLILAFVYLGIISLGSGSSYVALWTHAGEAQALRIKKEYVRSALGQDAKFFDLHNREEMPTVVANAMVHINEAIGRHMADTWANAWTAFGCLAVAFLLNWALALVMLCVVPVAAFVIMVLACWIRKNSREASGQFAAAGALATEAISGIKTVAALCAEHWALGRYQTLVQGAQQHSVFAGFLAGLSAGITGFLFYTIYVVAFSLGTYQVAERSDIATFLLCFFKPDSDPKCDINGASVMCCIYGVIICATFIGLMAPGLNAINQGRQAAFVIFETIERVPEIDASSSSGGRELDDDKNQNDTDKNNNDRRQQGCQLEFRNLSFAYPSRPNDSIFQDLNLVVEAGTSLALVGPSGSGKSSIARLLLRFYDPTSGELLVDGSPLPSLNLQWWRSQVGYVAQEPILFPGTIMDNIRSGNPAASDQDVVEAAKAASADDFIRQMPDGYNTFYSGTSMQLSGGQLQRICIARAIVRDISLLLLDEATSALDTNSERQVQEAFENIRKMKKITTITIAHRLSTIVSSDQIAVISNGNIAELGTHQSLLQQEGGIYATLCESQGITLDHSSTTTNGESSTTHQQPNVLPHKETGTAIAKQDEKDVQEGPMLEAKQDAEQESEEQKLASMARLWSMSKWDTGYLVMGALGSMLVGALSPAEAILTANIVANFYTEDADEMFEENWVWILSFGIFAIASIVGNLMSACGMSVSGYRLTRRMRTLTFEAIIRRHMGWFDVPEHSTGELTSRLEGDAEAVAKVTGWSLGYRIRVFSSLATGIVIALKFSWQIGATALCCAPIIMSPAIIQRLCLSKRFLPQSDGLSPSTILEQALRGINSIQAFNLQQKVFEQYEEALKPENRGKLRKGLVAGLVYGLSQSAIFCSFAIVFWVGSELLTAQEVDFVEFFTPVLAVMFGAVAVAQVNADFNAQQDGKAAAARLFAIIDEPFSDKDPFSQDGEQPSSINGSISYEALSFHYPTRPENMIFHPSKNNSDGFSLSLEPKKTVAFVGKSGCGKSTALQILLRFYDPTAGHVLLDSLQIQSLNISWLRKNIGYVGQMPVLFAGTVRENIVLGKKDATDEEVESAAKAANAYDFIMGMSKGFDTDIGTGGSLLSGGQRQRLAIARAIVSNPPLLVLDEATAALDNESERIVQAALDDLQEKQPRTTLVVAHRLATVKNCDQIAVLGNGGVKELGTHESLLKEKGLYYELWTKQVGATPE